MGVCVCQKKIHSTPESNVFFSLYVLLFSNQVGAAWLFALLGGPACERFGRKPVILAASVVFTVGAVVMAVALSKEVRGGGGGGGG